MMRRIGLLLLFLALAVPASAEVLTWPAVTGATSYQTMVSNQPNNGTWQNLSVVPAGCNPCSFTYTAPSTETWIGVAAKDATGKEIVLYTWHRNGTPVVFQGHQ